MREKQTVTIEPRAYGPDSTEAEKAALRARVTLIAKDIILLREVPVQTVFQVDLMFDEMERLTKSMGTFYELVDLTEVRRPPVQIRHRLRERITRFDNLKYVALFTGKNFLLNMAAKFVFGTTSFQTFSVHKTREEALLAIQKIRNGGFS